MALLRLAIIDPDTSHADAFAESLSHLRGAQLTCLSSTSGVRNARWIAEYAERWSLRVLSRIDELSLHADAALILTLDWRKHYALAEKITAFGLAVFVDKPLCDSTVDVDRFMRLVRDPTRRIFGSSSLPFASQQLIDNSVPGKRVTIRGPGESYFMRIHLMEILAASLLMQTSRDEIEQLPLTRIDDVTRIDKYEIRYADEWSIDGTVILLDRVYDPMWSRFVDWGTTRAASMLAIPLLAVELERCAVLSQTLSRPVSIGEFHALGESSIACSDVEHAEFIRSYRDRQVRSSS